MKHIELKGQLREATGKKAIKALRKEGLVPCNIYGLGMENIHFAVDAKALRPITHTPNSYSATVRKSTPFSTSFSGTR